MRGLTCVEKITNQQKGHSTMKRRTVLSLAAFTPLAAILSACGGSTNNNSMGSTHGMGSGSTGNTTMPMETGPLDQQFIDMMVPHHQAAVEMAKIAQMRGEHPEVKTLAANIIMSQSSEITQMTNWRKSWYGSDQTPPMDKMPMLAGMPDSDVTAMSHMMTDMQNLQTANPFDKAFLQAMLPHHQSAVDAAKIAQMKGEHAEIKTLAGAIIADQNKEITQMQGWLKAWYGV